MPEKPSISISVRDLVEFVLRTGDLGGDGGFVGPTRALEGTLGHQRVQRSRPAGYRAELPIRHRIETEEFVLCISGRIDGVLQADGTAWLEEIKTRSGPGDASGEPLHWAQARIYAFVFAEEHGLETIDVQLT